MKFILVMAVSFFSGQAWGLTQLEKMEHKTYSGGAQLQLNKQTESCQHFELMVPTYDDRTGKWLDFKFFGAIPKQRGSVPLIIEITSTEGVTQLETALIVPQLCRKGAAIIVADVSGFEMQSGPNALPHFFAETIFGLKAVRTLIDAFQSDKKLSRKLWMTESQIDLSRIGLIGVSNGSIPAIFLSAIDKRIRTLIMVAGFANIASVMAETPNLRVSQLMTEQKKLLGLKSNSEMKDYLSKKIAVDPKDLGHLLYRVEVLNLTIINDPTISEKHQHSLTKSIAHAQTDSIGNGLHQASIQNLFSFRKKLYLTFLRKSLNF